jgi:hypothetical protein
VLVSVVLVTLAVLDSVVLVQDVVLVSDAVVTEDVLVSVVLEAVLAVDSVVLVSVDVLVSVVLVTDVVLVFVMLVTLAVLVSLMLVSIVELDSVGGHSFSTMMKGSSTCLVRSHVPNFEQEPELTLKTAKLHSASWRHSFWHVSIVTPYPSPPQPDPHGPPLLRGPPLHRMCAGPLILTIAHWEAGGASVVLALVAVTLNAAVVVLKAMMREPAG